MQYLMGIDLGSTSLKAIIYDLDGNMIASGSRPTEKFHPKPEWTTWEPDQIWGGTADAIKDAVAQIDDPASIKAVAVTGMGMDGVPLDENGQHLYPFISWHDPRTAPQLQWWKENIGAEKVFSIGGNPLWAINSALRMLWVRENEPEIFKRTHSWLLIEDFLNYKLTGRQVTDYSMASCTLLFDQRKRDWSEEMLRLSGLSPDLMPEVLPSATPIGEISSDASKATGLPAGTPVILGGHDHICGTLPVGAFRPGVALDITGTWECVLTAITEPVLTPRVHQTGVTIQSHVARGLYTAWGGTPAGECVEWFRTQFGHEAQAKADAQGGSQWDHLVAEAETSPAGANDILFLPHLSAVSCPVEDTLARGAFIGLTNRATRGDMLRAVFEGLDYQFLDIVNAMEIGLDRKMEEFVAVGGAVNNAFWMQNKADITGRPLQVPAIEEASPLGAAILAGIGLGLYKDEQEAFERVYRPGKTYEPNPETKNFYADRYAVYKEMYTTLKSLNHKLSGGE